ncbi:arginyl-tRNA--protein transferase 1-like isoform X1 [Macrosteles quadrilineatus]|uniref:arginyl-tRNA--protein transferase 1-like isoform X1 n=1 Tax=Macrosteles quadrilineatus TaxID=74068 RepID=UPI0023E30776|nr:arginyl-tRNA--protein transferase 1-like isoform X1 [Macrosteles quadrilineatus]
MTSHDISIVDYYAENNGYRCGYCKSPNTNYSHGMWAHSLTVQDYQDLIDRGWRRSGSYCYKPTMHLTCCPMYTIKCSALDFKLSKSQKRKLKRFQNFLAYGRHKSSSRNDDAIESTSDMESTDEGDPGFGISDFPDLKEKAHSNASNAVLTSVESSLQDSLSMNEDGSKKISIGESQSSHLDIKTVETNTSTSQVSITYSTSNEMNEGKTDASVKPQARKGTRPGDGMDPNRPKCKKAKLLRQERKEKKLAQMGTLPPEKEKNKPAPTVKSLEDFLNEPLPENPAHRLEIRLVRSYPASHEFTATFKAAFEVYQRYQMTIHNDPIEKVNEKQFTRFLVNSPLKPWMPRDGPPQGYGSFHQQYWLDGRLIAVGVLDILPSCVSSVYFFYDPEFHFLVLGTYGSLREIAFCRSLHHSAPSLRYYYMGFYIHSCPKMRYKGAYYPSLLLCPEVYTWHPIEYCIPLLEKSKYSRFNEDPNAKDTDQVVDINLVTVLYHHRAMTYHQYISLSPSNTQKEEVEQYASLVGNKLSRKMLLLIT